MTVSFPRQAGALELGPPEAADGVLTRPRILVPPEGGSAPESQLLKPLIFLLLVADVLPYHFFVPSDRGHEISPGPKVLPDKIAFALAIRPRHVDGALALDEPDHLRHSVFRWDRKHHMDVVGPNLPWHG